MKRFSGLTRRNAASNRVSLMRPDRRDHIILAAYFLRALHASDLYWKGFDHTLRIVENCPILTKTPQRLIRTAHGWITAWRGLVSYDCLFRRLDRARAETNRRDAKGNSGSIFIRVMSRSIARQGRWATALQSSDTLPRCCRPRTHARLETAFTLEALRQYSEAQPALIRHTYSRPRDHNCRSTVSRALV